MTRTMSTTVAAGIALLLASTARAEQRTFIIANDGTSAALYACLRSAADCSSAVINAACRDRGFRQAVGDRKLGRDEITGDMPSGDPAAGHDLYAIECVR